MTWRGGPDGQEEAQAHRRRRGVLRNELGGTTLTAVVPPIPTMALPGRGWKWRTYPALQFADREHTRVNACA